MGETEPTHADQTDQTGQTDRADQAGSGEQKQPLDVDPVAAGETEPELGGPSEPTAPGSEGGYNGGA